MRTPTIEQIYRHASVRAYRPDPVQAELVETIDRYRRERNRGTVTPFRLDLYDAEEGIVQIGEGSLGGKGRGLAFASRLLDEVRLSDRFNDWPEARGYLPKSPIKRAKLSPKSAE